MFFFLHPAKYFPVAVLLVPEATNTLLVHSLGLCGELNLRISDLVGSKTAACSTC